MLPLPLHRIPVQTGANCALFAVISATRRLGCDPAVEDVLIRQLDLLEKADPRTFIGEVLSVDLLLDLIRGISQNNRPLFDAQVIAFSIAAELAEVVRESERLGTALLIPFARPASYDAYYRLLAQAENIPAPELSGAEAAKEAESMFLPADAHWALVNCIDETDRITLADSFEDVWGGGHGYEITLSAEKLAMANVALDGHFDWSHFLDERGRVWGMKDILSRAYAPSTPRSKNPARLEALLRDGMLEPLELAGCLIQMERNG